MPLLPENVVALGRIGGPLLDRNLKRKNAGTGEENLAFGNTSLVYPNVLYLDVINGRIGINTDVPSHDFIVNNARTTNLIVPTQSEIENFVISSNIIQNVSTTITISPDQSTNPVIDMVKIGTYDYGSSLAYLNISDQLIENIKNNDDIELSPDGTGSVNITTSKLYVDGNFTATGSMTWDGSLITLGSSDSDNVVFNAEINSNIVPDDNETWDLGSALKRWNVVRGETVPVGTLSVDNLSINGIDMLLTQGNTIYVSINGSDTNVGTHLHNTYKTIKKALTVATAGDTVVIFPGTYEEEFPLTVPAGVTVNGAGIRAVTVVPTVATEDQDCFLLNGETTVNHLTVKNFYYNATNNTGYAFRFASNLTVTSRSPYVQNCSVITATSETASSGEITVGPAPTGLSYTSDSVSLSKDFYNQSLVDSLVGQTAVIDRYPNPPLYYTVVSIETDPLYPTLWKMTVDTPFNIAGQLKPISFYPDVEITQIVTNDIWDTTGSSVGEKWVAYYKTGLPPWFNTVVGAGWSINVAGTLYIVDYIIQDPVNANMWRIYVTTSLVGGVGIPIFSSPIGATTKLAGRGALVDGSVATASSKEASMLFHSVTMITPGVTALEATNGARVEWLDCFTYFADKGLSLTEGADGFAGLGLKFGAELRSIGSANIYGNYGAVADGASTIAYLINHNFAYIGTGTDYTNDQNLVIQANEVVEQNNGRIYYESVDHKGDFRIGDIFYVNQETGAVTFNAQSISFLPNGSITLTGPTSSAFIDATMIEVGNIRISGNTIESLTGPVNFLANSGTTTLNTDVFVTGNADISADVIVKGNLYLGNQPTDTVTIYPEFTQDLLPDDVGPAYGYTLGTTGTRWDTLFVNSSTIDNIIEISNNTISTITADTDLIFKASTTGKVLVSNTNVQIDQDLTINGTSLTVNGQTYLQDLDLVGTITQTGNWNQTGNTDIIGDVFADNISITGTGSYFTVPNFKFENTTISVTSTNQDLILEGNGTGGVVFDDVVKIYGTNIQILPGLSLLEDGSVLITESGVPYALEGDVNTSENLVFAPNGTGNTIIYGTNAFQIPVGSTATRSLGLGEIRYNSVTNLYEGGGASGGLISFNGLYDSDRNTYISAGGVDNTIYFGISNSVKATIDSTALESSTFAIDNIQLNGNNITNTASGNDLTLLPTGTGNTLLNNVGFSSDSTITNQSNQPLVLKATGTGYISFAAASAIVIPFGVSAERRLTPEVGETRFNTEKQYMEVYTGDLAQGESGWVSAIGESAGIVDANVIEGLLDFWTLILG